MSEKYSKEELRKVSIRAALPVYLPRVRRKVSGSVAMAMLTTEEIRSILCGRGKIIEFLDNGESRVLDFSNYDIKPSNEKDKSVDNPTITEIKVNDPTRWDSKFRPVNNTFYS